LKKNKEGRKERREERKRGREEEREREKKHTMKMINETKVRFQFDCESNPLSS